MYKIKKYRILIIIIILIIGGCSKKFKHPVVSKFKKTGNVVIDYNEVSLLFNSDSLKEVKTFTKKKFTECNLVFTPVREYNLNNSISVFINYISERNYVRLDIFLESGKIHLFEKRGDKVKTYVYTHIRPFYNNHEENIYELNYKDRLLSLLINNQSILTKKISFSYGKIGVGAYGKKGDRVKFIFKSGK